MCFFQNLLSNPSYSTDADALHSIVQLISKTLMTDQQQFLEAPSTRDKIVSVIKSMLKNKALGPLRYPIEFFLAAWESLGEQIVEAIAEFFASGRLLKQVNTTLITLVPKCPHPLKVSDFCPISCCKTLYKCIANLLADRLKKQLSSIISLNQCAFIEGRKILDNVLLAQEIVKDYSSTKGKPRCALKLDIRKAFDYVKWDFSLHTL